MMKMIWQPHIGIWDMLRRIPIRTINVTWWYVSQTITKCGLSDQITVRFWDAFKPIKTSTSSCLLKKTFTQHVNAMCEWSLYCVHLFSSQFVCLIFLLLYVLMSLQSHAHCTRICVSMPYCSNLFLLLDFWFSYSCLSSIFLIDSCFVDVLVIKKKNTHN